ncbi:MAG: T9SS type A sorting domain-containing protein [Flavobacteriales bacterium]|nr:T9SS type A sorting domain-containing protein [Flavobacteriales bacterium]
MKIWTLLLASSLTFSLNTLAQTETLHDFTATTILGESYDFSTLAGKRVLIVNTATLCAFTPQYDDLQQLYSQYDTTTFEIIGFPANDFMNQEPDDDSTINGFCTGVYGVTFQMMSKIAVTGSKMPEIYKWLTQQSRNGVMDANVTWNFQKFMIDEFGRLIDTVSPGVSPLTAKITNWLDQPVMTGIESDNQKVVDLSLFPNPASGIVNLELEFKNPSAVEISLFSLTGELLENLYNGQITNEFQFTYNTENLDKGIYFIRIEAEGYSKVQKLVVAE